MAERWGKLALGDVIPAEIADAVTTINTFITAIAEVQKIVADATKLTKTTSIADIATTLLNNLIQEVSASVEALLATQKVHILFIPLPKKTGSSHSIELPPTLDDYTSTLGYSWANTKIQFSSGIKTSAEIIGEDVQTAAASATNAANAAYTQLLKNRNGGNHSFFTTFAESLTDALDESRPLYESHRDVVACGVVLTGAPSFTELATIASAFNRLFKTPTLKINRIIPIPQDVKIYVATTAETGSKPAIGIKWQPPNTEFTWPYIPDVAIKVKRYAVIRSSRMSARSATNVIDLIGTQDIKTGLEAQDAKVLNIGSGKTSTYIDTDKLDVTKTYYYCVAWEIEITENKTTTVLPWDLISAVKKVTLHKNQRSYPNVSTGIPPDWVSYGSLLDLMPDLALTLRNAINLLKGAGGALSVNTTIGSIDLIKENIETLLAQVRFLSESISNIATAFPKKLPNIYATAFYGIGGNAFLLGELASRLADVNDPSRPPFDQDEYVIGLIAVTGGGRFTDVAPFITLFNLLFHTTAATLDLLTPEDTPAGLAQTPVPPPPDPLFTALDSLDALINEEEEAVFDQSFAPTDQEVNPATGLPTEDNFSIFSDELKGIEGNDPTNPESGKTGKAEC